MRIAPALLVCSLAAALACGGDSTGPSPSDLGGAWDLRQEAFTFSDAPSVACTMTSTLSLTQSGTVLNGTFGPIAATCSAGDQSQSQTFSGGTVASGQRNGSSVTFYLNDTRWAFVGSVKNDGSMAGDVTVAFSDGTSGNGHWVATRHASSVAAAGRPPQSTRPAADLSTLRDRLRP